jgi:hypothetical protein
LCRSISYRGDRRGGGRQGVGIGGHHGGQGRRRRVQTGGHHPHGHVAFGDDPLQGSPLRHQNGGDAAFRHKQGGVARGRGRRQARQFLIFDDVGHQLAGRHVSLSLGGGFCGQTMLFNAAHALWRDDPDSLSPSQSIKRIVQRLFHSAEFSGLSAKDSDPFGVFGHFPLRALRNPSNPAV